MIVLMPLMVKTLAAPNAPEEVDIYTPAACPASILSIERAFVTSAGLTVVTEPVISLLS